MTVRERGGFITLEGGEGAGKSTQAVRLLERLKAQGVEALATREPGGSPRAEAIRAALLSGAVAPLGPVAEALLFSAARIDHIETKIGPALERGAFVICDRFVDSTRVYQGQLGQIPPGLMASLEHIVVGDTMPDLTIVLDVVPATGLARAKARRGAAAAPDRFEREGQGFHERLRAGFLAIAAREPERCRVVDGAKPADEVAEAIWAAVMSRFPRLRETATAPGAEHL